MYVSKYLILKMIMRYYLKLIERVKTLHSIFYMKEKY